MALKRLIDWFEYPGEEKYELRLQYPNAKAILLDYLDWKLGGNVLWFPWYDELVKWLTDNEGKGLVLYGPAYVGKTTIARDFIPQLLRTTRELIIHSNNATDLNNVEITRSTEPFMYRFMKIIEGVGKERMLNDYGIRFEPFNKVVDDVIAHSKFLIITTSYNPQQIAHRYGNDTLNNLAELCKFIECKPHDAQEHPT